MIGTTRGDSQPAAGLQEKTTSTKGATLLIKNKPALEKLING
jgi:hypothetical protein